MYIIEKRREGIGRERAGHKFKLPAECSKRRRDGESGTRTPPLLSATRRQTAPSAGQKPPSPDGEQQQQRGVLT